MNLKKETDISKYFRREKDKWIFTGDKLEVWIPRIYQERDLLVISDVATCLGIFQLRINDSVYANTMMLARLVITFISIRSEIEDGVPYLVLLLEKDSVFITNSFIVKDSNVIYEVFITFLALGKIPSFIDYSNIQRLFDRDNKDCDVSLKINHSIFEMIYAHCYRDRNDPYNFYRHTDMKEPPIIVSLHQISHGPSSTTARIVGSYLDDGMVSSLVDETEHAPSLIENLLR